LVSRQKGMLAKKQVDENQIDKKASKENGELM
jgi:hypothetical protein